MNMAAEKITTEGKGHPHGRCVGWLPPGAREKAIQKSAITKVDSDVLNKCDIVVTFWKGGIAWIKKEYLLLRVGSIKQETESEIHIERCEFGKELILFIGPERTKLEVLETVANILVFSHDESS